MQLQPRALVRMPDLVGLPYTKAKFIVENLGLELDHVVFQESYAARNLVLGQLPLRGQMVYAGGRVVLGISRDSYARWLPALYQRADLSGRNFVKELLWIVQHLFGSIEELLDGVHLLFDPYEAPEEFLPWLGSWTAMVLEEDWPLAKKRRLIKRAVELYRLRGTAKGLRLFISLFTGHEPELRENEWPWKGWRIGVDSAMGVDTIVLPPVNLAHTFIVEMPMAYQDITTEAVVRIHEIVRMEKPAHTQYYLRFISESSQSELRSFYTIGTRSGIGIGAEVMRLGAPAEDAITPDEPLPAVATTVTATTLGASQGAATVTTRAPEPVEPSEEDALFVSRPRIRRPLPKAPRADNAPIEGREVRSREEGFGASARAMSAVGTTTATGAAASQELGAVPQPLAATGEGGDTDEHAVTSEAAGTMISSTPQRIADDMKQDDEPEPPPADQQTTVRGRKKDDKGRKK